MPTVKGSMLQLLGGHRVMTIATNRPDGWPQATMVGYLNDGFLLYCFVARNAQTWRRFDHHQPGLTAGPPAPEPRIGVWANANPSL